MKLGRRRKRGPSERFGGCPGPGGRDARGRRSGPRVAPSPNRRLEPGL